MWLSFFYVLTAIVCAICALVSLHSARSAAAERELLAGKLRSCESRIRSGEESTLELFELVQKLAQSQKMQRVRAASTHAVKANSNGEPDVRTEPEAWRAWQNSKLKTGVVN